MNPPPFEWPADTAIVIPSYKAKGPLKKLLEQLIVHVPAGAICVVDDASFDGTESMCNSYGIPCLTHEYNQGKGAAMNTGAVYFITHGFSWIITMDADGQHAVEDLPLFIRARWPKPTPGIVAGWRDMSPGVMPISRIFSNRLTSGFVSLLTGQSIRDSQCGYRLYATELLKKVPFTYNRFEAETEIILKACALGYPVCFIKVQTLYLDGQSNISHIKDTFRWIFAVLKVWFSLRKK